MQIINTDKSKNPNFIVITLAFFSIISCLFLLSRKPRTEKKYICKDCNVILVGLDTLRADKLPCYGYSKNTAENLCGFANKSYFFENNYTTTTSTLPSTASVFTSLLPDQHGLKTIIKDKLPQNIVTLAEILQTNGYTNYWSAPINNPYVPIDKGLERGFEVFDVEDQNHPFNQWKITLDKLIAKPNKSFLYLHSFKVHFPYAPNERSSIERFANGISSPFFLTNDEFEDRLTSNYVKNAAQLVKFIDPTYYQENQYILDNPKEDTWLFRQTIDNYLLKEDLVGQQRFQLEQTINDTYRQTRWSDFGVNTEEQFPPQFATYRSVLYDAGVYELDQDIGKFLDYLKENHLLDKSIVIFFSGHGEALNEHNEGIAHATSLYQPTIKTPLIIYLPNEKGAHIKENVSIIDIMPTILDAVGINTPKQAKGLSLFPLIMEGAQTFKSRPLFCSRELWTHWGYEELYQNKPQEECVIFENWKLIVKTNSEELFNLVTDPNEINNLAAERADMIQKLKVMLQNDKESRKYFNTQNNPFPTYIDEKTRKRLIETGYF